MSNGDNKSINCLTGILREIAECAGLKAALLLASAAGGTDIYVPKRPRGGKLVAIVGLEAACEIAKLYGKENILVPLGPAADRCRKRSAIAKMLEGNLAVQEIARRVGTHVRTVQRANNRVSNQIDLFTDTD